MADVFISYKAEEFNDANWVKQTLETNGISCWMAPMSIPGGSNYAVEIPQAIRAANVFVLILSEKSQLSKWVPRELDQAINEGKTILPFMLENCPLRDDFNFYLSNVQRYAAYENKSVAIERMIHQIRAILNATEQSKYEPDENVKGEKRVEENWNPNESISDLEKVEELCKSKPQKSNRIQKAKPKENKKSNLKLLFVAIGIVAFIFVIVMISTAIVIGSRVTIAGKKYNKSDSYITVNDVELSAEDIAALSEFKKLSGIYITNCEIPANSLNSIFKTAEYRVELVNCGLTNEELSKVSFKNVTANAICLDGNEGLSDLNGISALGEKLQDLSFNGCSVIDISFVEALSSLRKLAFDSNNVDDISVLNKCIKLEKLSAANNSIKSLSSLSACTKLEEVSVGSNELFNLNGLEPCILIKKIYASNNSINDINGIQNATLLTEVDLSDNDVEDITILSKSKDNLKKLNLSNNRIENIDALNGCVLIAELDISHNSIETLDSLSALTAIISINVSYNRITDVTGLKSSKKLIDVDLSNNMISDISSLSFDSSAYSISLDVSYNTIASLAVPNIRYKYLSLFGNPISDFSAVNETNGSTLVFGYASNIDFEALGNANYYDYYIIDCPLDKQVGISGILGSNKVHFVSEEELINLGE